MDKSDVIDVLNDLINTSKDGEYGFDSCAEHAKSADLKTLFTQRAVACRQAADELQACVVQYGGKPDDSGSVSGAMHRGWVAVRGTLSGYSDQAMLDECERGEDTAKARYKEALSKALPADVQAIVQRQYDGVLRNHDQIRALRNAGRAQA